MRDDSVTDQDRDAPVQAVATRYQEHQAVDRLQDAARRGVPVLIPGAFDPLRFRPSTPGPPSASPHARPAVPPPIAMSLAEREATGTPQEPVTVREKVAHGVLTLVEALIRWLSTPASGPKRTV